MQFGKVGRQINDRDPNVLFHVHGPPYLSPEVSSHKMRKFNVRVLKRKPNS